jgi:peroxiredoxin Q/BCP
MKPDSIACALCLALPLAALACGRDSTAAAAPPATSANAATMTANAAPMPNATPPSGGAPAPTAASTSTSPPALAVPTSVSVGAPPPDFTAKASDGTDIHLAAFKGKPVVVYFYPKDETPGCTKEACSFRDAWDGLSKAGVVLIGVSGDTDDSHKAFAGHYKLPFHLVSDPNGAIAGQFGVPFTNGYAARQSFVIGPDGNVKKIYRKVDVTVHAQEIAADVRP